MAEPYIINNPQAGIADSPELGFGDMRNIDVYTQPGVAKINRDMKEWTFNSSANGITKTFTASAATDKITLPTGDNFIHDYIGNVTAQPVTLTTTTTLPAPLAPATTYYLISGGTNTTYKLATTIANAEAGTGIDILDTGTGTHTITAVVPGNVKHQVIEPSTGYVYAQDATGLIWVNRGNRWITIAGNTLTNATGNGLVIWKNYLFAFRSGAVDVLSLSTYAASGTSAWTNAWKTTQVTASGTVHNSIAGQDDILYYCDGRYIGSVAELAGTTFAPGTPGTFNHNAQALDLPQDYVARDLAELGKPLMIGAGRDNEAACKIFPWDRTSSSFSLPLSIPNGPLNIMQTIGSRLYVSVGTEGTVWVTDGTNVEVAFRIPVALNGSSNSGSITSMCAHKNRLFFGLTSDTTSGVWSFNPATKALLFEYLVSYGRYNDSLGLNPLLMSSMVSINANKLSASWYDSNAALGAIDTTNIDTSTYYYQSYAAYLRGPLSEVGTNFQPRTFEQVSLQLEKPLATNEGIRIKYRPDTSSAFTTIGTFDYTTYGAIQSLNFQYAIDAENIQAQVELTGTTTTPSFKELRLD
jgi:hypothetical protein